MIKQQVKKFLALHAEVVRAVSAVSAAADGLDVRSCCCPSTKSTPVNCWYTE